MPLHQSLKFIHEQVKTVISKNYNLVETYLEAISKDDTKDGVYVSLLYAEEEKTLKNNEYMQTCYEPEEKKIKGYKKVNPKIYLNLYILIASCNQNNYAESLKHISTVISHFRGKNVFEKEDFTGYNNLHKLILDIHTLSFDQNNSLWQSIGSKLYPYIVYKLRTVAFTEPRTEPDMKPIQKILAGFKHYNKVQVIDENNNKPLSEEEKIALEIRKKYIESEINRISDVFLNDKEANEFIIVDLAEIFNGVKEKLKEQKP